MLTIGLCVICHNRPVELGVALESAHRDTWDEVVVLDMASEPPLEEVPGVHLLRSEENLGVAGGRNLLAATADSDLLVFLDDDAAILTAMVPRLRAHFADHDDLAVVGFKIQRKDGHARSHELPFRGDPPVSGLCEAAYFLGGAHAIRKSAMTEVGAYDARFFYDGEETDLSFALLGADHRIWFDPAIVVEHRPTSHSRVVAPHVAALTWRNRILIARRHFPWAVAGLHLCAWAMRSGRMAVQSGDVQPWLRAWRSGARMPVRRQPIDWATLCRAHQLGGRVLW